MVQTINMKSDGIAEICGDGFRVSTVEHATLSDGLQSKVDSLYSALSSAGASEIHIEKDTWRQFEHLIVAGEVLNNEFGTTFSSSDFDDTLNLASSFASEVESALQAEISSGYQEDPIST